MVAEKLLAAGFRVRAFVRDLSRGEYLARLGAELMLGDYADQASVDAANRGVEGVFFVAPYLNAHPGVGSVIANAAKHAGVQLVVWNTTGEVPPVPTGNAGVDCRLEVRSALSTGDVPFVALEPTIYMENFLGPWTAPELAANSIFAYPLPSEAYIQPIAQADVAAFVVEAFRRPDLAGSNFKLCGPDKMDGMAIAKCFSSVLGREVRFRSMPPEEFGAVLDDLLGPGAGDAATAFYRAAFSDPKLISTAVQLSDVLDVLPIVPTPLAAWVRQHSSSFATLEH